MHIDLLRLAHAVDPVHRLTLLEWVPVADREEENEEATLTDDKNV